MNIFFINVMKSHVMMSFGHVVLKSLQLNFNIYFTAFSTVSIVDFEQANVSW